MNHKWCVEVMRLAQLVWGHVRYLATPTGNFRPSVTRKPATSTYLFSRFALGVGGSSYCGDGGADGGGEGSKAVTST